jgi:hypothetical protein
VILQLELRSPRKTAKQNQGYDVPYARRAFSGITSRLSSCGLSKAPMDMADKYTEIIKQNCNRMLVTRKTGTLRKMDITATGIGVKEVLKTL